MKKLYIAMIALLFTMGASAQYKSEQTVKLFKPLAVARNPHQATGIRATTTSNIWLDYDSADAFVGNYGVPDALFIWPMNKRFSEANGDTAWNNTIVAFDTLYDIYSNQAINS